MVVKEIRNSKQRTVPLHNGILPTKKNPKLSKRKKVGIPPTRGSGKYIRNREIVYKSLNDDNEQKFITINLNDWKLKWYFANRFYFRIGSWAYWPWVSNKSYHLLGSFRSSSSIIFEGFIKNVCVIKTWFLFIVKTSLKNKHRPYEWSVGHKRRKKKRTQVFKYLLNKTANKKMPLQNS